MAKIHWWACLGFDLWFCFGLLFFLLNSMKEFPNNKGDTRSANYFPLVEKKWFTFIFIPLNTVSQKHRRTIILNVGRLYKCLTPLFFFFPFIRGVLTTAIKALWFRLGRGWEEEREVILDFNEEAFNIWRAPCLLEAFQYHGAMWVSFQDVFLSRASASKTGNDASCELILPCRKPGSYQQNLNF